MVLTMCLVMFSACASNISYNIYKECGTAPKDEKYALNDEDAAPKNENAAPENYYEALNNRDTSSLIRSAVENFPAFRHRSPRRPG